jgi:hypothetical protein
VRCSVVMSTGLRDCVQGTQMSGEWALRLGKLLFLNALLISNLLNVSLRSNGFF